MRQGESEIAADSVSDDLAEADSVLEHYLISVDLMMEDQVEILSTTLRLAEMIQRERLETRRFEELEDIAKSLAVLSMRNALPGGPSPIEAIAMALGYTNG
jgi:hypothetical protein